MVEAAREWFLALRVVLTLTAFCWVVEIVNHTVGHGFNRLGIYPRDIASLPGIMVWPFLHAGIPHLVMNTTPLVFLGFFVALRGPGIFLTSSLLIVILGGIGVWLFGRPAYHIGASGLVFGYFGFLVALGFYEKSLKAMLVALLTLFYYGGLIFGVLPTNSFVSWEGHLFGLLAGILAARLLAMRPGQSRHHD